MISNTRKFLTGIILVLTAASVILLAAIPAVGLLPDSLQAFGPTGFAPAATTGVLWALALAVLLIGMRLYQYLNEVDGEAGLRGKLEALQLELEDLRAEIDELRAAAELPAAQVRGHLASIEATLNTLHEERVPVRESLALRAEGEAGVPEPPAPELPTDALELYLQPVVDLATAETAAYRTSFMIRGDGDNLASADAALAREGEAMLAALDAHRFDRIEQLTEQLVVPAGSSFLIVRLNVASLTSAERLKALLARREFASGLYEGIVFEITQPALAILAISGTREAEAFKLLVSSGAAFCLAVGLGPLPAIAELAAHGIRFLTVPVENLAVGGPVIEAQTALAMSYGMEIIVAGISTPEQRAQVQRFASLGFGPLYSAPRLIAPPAGPAPEPDPAPARPKTDDSAAA